MFQSDRIQVIELNPELRRRFKLIGSPAKYGVFWCGLNGPDRLIRAAIAKESAEDIRRTGRG